MDDAVRLLPAMISSITEEPSQLQLVPHPARLLAMKVCSYTYSRACTIGDWRRVENAEL